MAINSTDWTPEQLQRMNALNGGNELITRYNYNPQTPSAYTGYDYRGGLNPMVTAGAGQGLQNPAVFAEVKRRGLGGMFAPEDAQAIREYGPAFIPLPINMVAKANAVKKLLPVVEAMVESPVGRKVLEASKFLAQKKGVAPAVKSVASKADEFTPEQLALYAKYMKAGKLSQGEPLTQEVWQGIQHAERMAKKSGGF